MDFITGQTFLGIEEIISDVDLDRIVYQAALINQIRLKPEYLFDSWAIPNIHRMYENVVSRLDDEDKQLIDQVIERFNRTIQEECQGLEICSTLSLSSVGSSVVSRSQYIQQPVCSRTGQDPAQRIENAYD